MARKIIDNQVKKGRFGFHKEIRGNTAGNGRDRSLRLKFRRKAMKRFVLSVMGFLLMTAPAFAGHPLVTDDTATQGTGNAQVELGMAYFCDKDKADNGTTVKKEGGEAAIDLTVGVLNTVDAVFGLPYAWYSVKENDGRVGREDGLSDMTFDVKWRFFEKSGWSLAVKPGISIPTGDEARGLGSGGAGLRVFLIATGEVEPVAIHANVGYTRQENTADERKDIWHASIAAEVKVIRNLKLLANIGIARNPVYRSDNHPVFFLGGAAYDLSDKITLDAGVKYGLTATETDWTGLAGLTVRF